MRAITNAKFLDIKTVGKNNSKLLTVYDGNNLLKLFIDEKQELELTGITFGKDLRLDLEVYLTKKNQMGYKLHDIKKVS